MASHRFLSIFVIAAVLTVSACQAAKPTSSSPSNGPTSGLDLTGIDKSVAPGDDFNGYTNGAWLKTTEIPPDKPSYGPDNILVDETRKRTVALIQQSADAADKTSGGARKIGDFYASYMDESGIEAKGAAPLKPELDEIAAIKDKRMLASVIGSTLRADVDPLNATNFHTENLFGIWVAQGLSDPSTNYPYILQGGIGMPDRDYYVSPDDHMKQLRDQYQIHIEKMFKLAGLDDEHNRAGRVFGLESKIAAAHATRTESADVQHAQLWKREDFKAKAPGLDWTTLFTAAGLQHSPAFFLWQPKAASGISALVAKEPLDAWKDWLMFHKIEQAAAFLSKAFVDERFAFFGKALFGIPEQPPRWQRGADFTSAALGEVVGKLYVEKYFPAEAKAKVRAMADDLTKAFNRRIDALDWMSQETKTKAKEKVRTLYIGVGYPDKWQDYSGLEVAKDDPLGNAQRAELFEYRRQLAKLNQPVDKEEWWMTPQTVNAVNLPLQNALNFPAAILQPPYFDAAADSAHNYGAIGAIIGHEISHSFDDQGSQFDAQGRLANWWTKQDLEHFKAAGEALAAQYDAYKPFPDLAVNGRQTLSENIADLAGLAVAYDAYQLSLGGNPDRVLDGFTGDQRFFISFGQSWRQKIREAALRNQITTNGHAPDQYRADTVRNLDPWYSAFSVEAGQKLYLDPKNRVRIW